MDLIGVHPVKHSDLGFNNTLFGGKLLYWIDGDAVAYAMEVCDTPRMVTVTMDKCVWQKAVGPSHLINSRKKIGEPKGAGSQLLRHLGRHLRLMFGLGCHQCYFDECLDHCIGGLKIMLVQKVVITNLGTICIDPVFDI